MNHSQHNHYKNLLIGTLVLIVLVLALVALKKPATTATNQSQATVPSQQNNAQEQAVQACMNNAHKQWDGPIAVAEGQQDQEPYNFDKSQLDQQLLNCQNYGQQ